MFVGKTLFWVGIIWIWLLFTAASFVSSSTLWFWSYGSV